MKRPMVLALLLVALAAGFAAAAGPAQAAVSSASVTGTTATLNLDGADDNVTVSVAGGLLVHGETTGGLHSGSDWDSATPGDQTVPANGTFIVVVNGGDGNDSLTVLAKITEINSATLNGDGGDDVLTGADTGDTLSGGDGNDRLIGAKGGDDMSGGTGNDSMVWNNGDNTDFIEGGDGTDTTEVNGNPILGDTFTLEPNAGRIRFRRTNLVTFVLDAATERFQVDGLGGDDTVTASAGVGALTLLSVDGGTGDDTINGSDGPDLIQGGEGNDTLNGGGGDDRIVGDRGKDTMNGGAGDDTLVWNNGDGTDAINGDDGRDDVEVNGAPTAGDAFTVQPNGARIKFERTNLVPFSLDIGSSETMHANGLGGDDTITVGEVGSYSVTASGGPGNDALTGGGASETLLGGPGNDTITPGAGHDVVSGDTGDDHVNIRDNAADVAFGGDGNDVVVADPANLDLLDGFETVDRTPVDTPPPLATPPPVATPPPADTSTRPVTIRGGTIKAINGAAPIKVSCPATSSGNCSGSLTLFSARSVRFAGLNAVLQIGRASYSLVPGAATTVKVKLPKGLQRVADRNGHLRVIAIGSTGASGRIASSSQRATLALGTSRKRK